MQSSKVIIDPNNKSPGCDLAYSDRDPGTLHQLPAVIHAGPVFRKIAHTKLSGSANILQARPEDDCRARFTFNFEGIIHR